MSVATRRVGFAGMRICGLVDPQYRAEMLELVQELIEAAALEALEQRAAQPSATPADEHSIAEPEPSSTAAASKSDAAAADGPGAPADGSVAVEQASQPESPRTVVVYGPDSLSALTDALKSDDVPRGTSEEPPAQRHESNLRTLAEIPNDERDRIYARWLYSREKNGGKVPADDYAAIAVEFNTTAKVVYNYAYHRFNKPGKKASERPVAATRMPVSERQKALSSLAPPTPRVERFKVRRVSGTYGGGE